VAGIDVLTPAMALADARTRASDRLMALATTGVFTGIVYAYFKTIFPMAMFALVTIIVTLFVLFQNVRSFTRPAPTMAFSGAIHDSVTTAPAGVRKTLFVGAPKQSEVYSRQSGQHADGHGENKLSYQLAIKRRYENDRENSGEGNGAHNQTNAAQPFLAAAFARYFIQSGTSLNYLSTKLVLV
jgi:hypothetical protein